MIETLPCDYRERKRFYSPLMIGTLMGVVECDGDGKCAWCDGDGDDPYVDGECCRYCGGDGECTWCGGDGCD